MPDAGKLRRQAEQTLRLVGQIIDETVSPRLTGLAEEYFSKAEERERSDKPRFSCVDSVPTDCRRLE
jgi:hypothetical protein